MALNLFAIPAGLPFLETLAKGWLRDRGADPLVIASGLILTPTRRAARGLAEAFLRVSFGRGLLLPRIVAFGAIDEAPLALAGALDLPPSVDPRLRLAVLTKLILHTNGAGGAPRTADRAWPLARELADLMDEADRMEIDLAARLPDAADPAFAAHWERTLEFLHIVTHAWPSWLDEHGVMNPAARQVALLNAQAEAWEQNAPDYPVVIAGTTASIPAVARLARSVARLPVGQVVLPVLDTHMSDSAWSAIEDSHPQSGLASLLASLDATRADVRPFSGCPQRHPAGCRGEIGQSLAALSSSVEPIHATASTSFADRFALLSRALLPAAALGEWRAGETALPDGMFRLKPRDSQEEAEAIAMILREVLERPGQIAALVTPDRDLAGRVAAALPRHGIIADDSAGEKLIESPPAVFLRLLAKTIREELAPVALLSLLKHPLAAAGLTPAACRQQARALEIAALRGPRPLPGLAGIRLAIADKGEPLNAFLSRVEACLEPVLRMGASPVAAPADALAALIAAAENLAATETETGDVRLWAEAEGDALAASLTAALAALPNLPDQNRDVMPGLLDALIQGEIVRTRRALRGRGGAEHPRVFIWGLLEARLQSVDIMILGGLVESIWPPAAEPGPWLSRPMRATVGLPSPEESVGAAAHDFLGATMAAPRVILSCPERRDGAPAVPARWLTRLEALLAGANLTLPLHPASSWARIQDHPAGGPKPTSPPRPCPPVAIRPSRLSVTEIETWLGDPYAIYAKHILRLSALKPLEQATEAADYGTIVHAGVHRFLRQHCIAWPLDADSEMREAFRYALAEIFPRAALAAWWEPRLDRIAGWIAATETKRRADQPLAAIETERSGSLDILRPGRRFTLTARADRIERRIGGQLGILDYKTGRVPSAKDVTEGWAPQLPLEAAMAAAGSFGTNLRGVTSEITYWHLTGGIEPGKALQLFKGKGAELEAAVDQAMCGLHNLIDQYDQPDRAYLAQPNSSWTPRFSDYAQLERVVEWALAADEFEDDQ